MITAGEPGDRFYLVRSGRLQVIGEDGNVRGTSSPAKASASSRCSTVAARRHDPQRWSRRSCGPSTAATSSAGSRTVTRSRRGSAPRPRSAPSWRRCRSSAASSRRSSTVSRPAWSPCACLPAGRSSARATPGTATTSCGRARQRFRSPVASVRRLGRGDGLRRARPPLRAPRARRSPPSPTSCSPGWRRNDFARLVSASGETLGEFRARTAHYVGAGRAGLGGAGSVMGWIAGSVSGPRSGRVASAAAGPAANTQRPIRSSSTSFVATNTQTLRALVVEDALHCGVCKPRGEPVDLPELE